MSLKRGVDGGAVIEIRDNGRGIPDEALPHVFERFYRADAARSSPGSGLGLTIARRIVEAHDGEVRAENREGGGAAFVITLPGLRREARP